MLYLYIGRYRESLLLFQPAKLRKALQHLIRTCSHRPGSLYRHQTAYSFLHRFVEVKSNTPYFSCQDAILLFTKLPSKGAFLFVTPLSAAQASMQILNFLAFFHPASQFMHFIQKFCMCQLFMRFIFDNDVRILGIFSCPMHDLPNICRSMGIVQMLVCFAIIL